MFFYHRYESHHNARKVADRQRAECIAKVYTLKKIDLFKKNKNKNELIGGRYTTTIWCS